MDLYDSGFNPDALGSMPKTLSSKQIDNRKVDPMASFRESEAKDRYNGRQVNHREGHKEALSTLPTLGLEMV